MNAAIARSVTDLIAMTKVLVIDDEPYMRKVIRSLLLANGLKQVHEAPNGRQGLDAICSISPDVVILDWEMPDMNGTEFMKIVRSPEKFPHPNVPVIMLTGHVERERVVEAISHGVHEYLCKPVSAKSLFERIVAVRAKPRPMVRIGNYYGPKPRKLQAEMPPPFPFDEGGEWLTGDR
jgi:CheY-like chemotaxis protein